MVIIFSLFRNLRFVDNLETKIQTGSQKKKRRKKKQEQDTEANTAHTYAAFEKFRSDRILHSYVTHTSRHSLVDEQRAVPQACEQEVRSLFQTQDRRAHRIPKVEKTLSRCVHAPIDQNTVEKKMREERVHKTPKFTTAQLWDSVLAWKIIALLSLYSFTL